MIRKRWRDGEAVLSPSLHLLRIMGCPFRIGQKGLVARVELPKYIDDLSQASFEGGEL